MRDDSARVWQDDRSGKNAGRVDVGEALLEQNAQVRAHDLSALSHKLLKHSPNSSAEHTLSHHVAELRLGEATIPATTQRRRHL